MSASVMPAAKTALVIGGSDVSVGIGAIVALARTQATLAVHCAPTKVEPIHARLRAAGLAPAISFYEADLASAKSIDAMMSRVLAELGHIDILINGGSVQYAGPLESMPVERWEQDIAVNLSACFHTCRRVLPGMRERNWGRIVNVSSSQGLVGSGYKAAYVAAKHGAVGMAKALALELVQTGITVNAICPGWVENSSFLVQQARERAAAEGVSEEAARATLLGKQPTGRFVGESDVGALIAFLCSDAADQIRGAAMSIDGGWCAQ
ncbi:MAG TPA: SDR family oxidoreductase [Aquabacterium sp.]|uniref:SDR family NAD(P)-dependent oxidoreductase n=1 Tax=Piscinibacter sp. TaxID=1903157 RepID=UPI001A53CE7B|nr:SDR family oxidoreductase [Burkholderiaceae bacterium]HQC94829.1 SDR family oxidoreductase [Aquabacterium sp.]